MRRLAPTAVLASAVAAGALMCAPRIALAEVSEIRIAHQFGVAYLPLMVMRHEKLIEKQAEKVGLAPLKVMWMTFGSGADMNVGLISRTLDFASGGIAPVLQIWDRTRGNLAVKGVAALGSLPLYLNTINPKVRTIKDFTSTDRVALPAVKVSIQALLLQMAASQSLRRGQVCRARSPDRRHHPPAGACGPPVRYGDHGALRGCAVSRPRTQGPARTPGAELL